MRIRGGYNIPLNEKVDFELDLSATYASEDYMESYFTVDAENSERSGLNIYDADSGVKDTSLQLTIRLGAWEKWSILCVASYTRLMGDAKHSPVVVGEGDDNQYLAGVGVSYRF